MVEKGCDSCRKWQEHYYWEHMDVSKIRFFKLMTGDFAKGTVSVHSLPYYSVLRQIFHCYVNCKVNNWTLLLFSKIDVLENMLKI